MRTDIQKVKVSILYIRILLLEISYKRFTLQKLYLSVKRSLNLNDSEHKFFTLWTCLTLRVIDYYNFTGHLKFHDLNEDVIFYIALFLDASDIHNSLSKVCKRFKEIFDNQAYWKARLFKNCSKPFPAVDCKWDSKQNNLLPLTPDLANFTLDEILCCNYATVFI